MGVFKKIVISSMLLLLSIQNSRCFGEDIGSEMLKHYPYAEEAKKIMATASDNFSFDERTVSIGKSTVSLAMINLIEAITMGKINPETIERAVECVDKHANKIVALLCVIVGCYAAKETYAIASGMKSDVYSALSTIKSIFNPGNEEIANKLRHKNLLQYLEAKKAFSLCLKENKNDIQIISGLPQACEKCAQNFERFGGAEEVKKITKFFEKWS